MPTKFEYAQLSLYVYKVQIKENRPELPTGWTQVAYHPDDLIGFSYGIFRNETTSEVVVSFTGTNEKKVADFLLANVPAGLGLGGPQVAAAAHIAAATAKAYGIENISFTGHSLGGGLASMMGVWYDRPATVFDQAPFELTARNYMKVVANQIQLTAAGVLLPSFAAYNPLLGYSARESKVSHYFTQDEALDYLRVLLPSVVGPVDAKVSANVSSMTSAANALDLHSQALLTALLMSNSFQVGTYASSRVLPQLFNSALYAKLVATSDERDILVDLIRSEEERPGNGKLSHFGADLGKLGNQIGGLDLAAQDAIMGQMIEWYYWQEVYAGSEFFNSGDGLLQYTIAMGADLSEPHNKAGAFAEKWLKPYVEAQGLTYSSSFVTTDQWNVVTGSNGVTGAADNADKDQIFIGGSGGDTFAGGNLSDVLFGAGGADTLQGEGGNDDLYGGEGDDQLLGGAGYDTYRIEGSDTVTDLTASDQSKIRMASESRV